MCRANNIGKVILIGSAAVHLPRVGKSADEAKRRSSNDADYLYDLTKRLQETIAQDFCETFEMTATALRAGHIVDGRENADPKGASLSELEYARGGWVCRYDLAAACLKAPERSETGFQVFHIIGSNGARTRFDVERAEQELGFKIAVALQALRIVEPQIVRLEARRRKIIYFNAARLHGVPVTVT